MLQHYVDRLPWAETESILKSLPCSLFVWFADHQHTPHQSSLPAWRQASCPVWLRMALHLCCNLKHWHDLCYSFSLVTTWELVKGLFTLRYIYGCLKQKCWGGLPAWSPETALQLLYVLSELNQSERVLCFLLHPGRKIDCLADNPLPPLPASPHLSKGQHLFMELLLPSVIAKLHGHCFYHWPWAKTTSISKPLNYVPIANFTVA